MNRFETRVVGGPLVRDVRPVLAPAIDSKMGYYNQYSIPFEVTYAPIRAGIFNIYLFGVIESAEQFINAIEVLQSASENDIVKIHLSSPGGSLDATDTFIHAMRQCAGRVVVEATGGVHSAGSIILMNADEFFLSENFNCLVHNGSLGSSGKYSEWKLESKHKEAYMERVMRNTYSGFLSEEELEDLLKGVDFWFDGTDFARRWEARNEFIKDKVDEVQAVLDKAAAMLAAPAEEVAPKVKRKYTKKIKNSVAVPNEA